MKNLLIRDIDESVIESWKQEAKRRGVSMQELLKQTINDNAPKRQKTKEEILKDLAKLRAKSGTQDGATGLELIQEGRKYLDDKMARIFEWE